MLKVVQRGQRRDNASKGWVCSNVFNPFAGDKDGAAIAQAVDEFLASTDSHSRSPTSMQADHLSVSPAQR
jgi:hypothetical protein